MITGTDVFPAASTVTEVRDTGAGTAKDAVKVSF
jgi:hypothetical protein